MHCCKRNAKCSNCGGAHVTVYRSCPAYQHKLAGASNKINEINFFAIAKTFKPQAKHRAKTIKLKNAFQVAEALSKVR